MGDQTDLDFPLDLNCAPHTLPKHKASFYPRDSRAGASLNHEISFILFFSASNLYSRYSAAAPRKSQDVM